MAGRKRDTLTVALNADLQGFTIDIDPQALTMGMIEDLQGGTATSMLDAVSSCVVGGTLTGGSDRAGLRRLTPGQFAAVCEGIAGCLAVPKKA
jgi:hypothetical protein